MRRLRLGRGEYVVGEAAGFTATDRRLFAGSEDVGNLAAIAQFCVAANGRELTVHWRNGDRMVVEHSNPAVIGRLAAMLTEALGEE
jgi:hypothetical protein